MIKSDKKSMIGNLLSLISKSKKAPCPNARRLSMESLEDRSLLAAWAGFDVPVENVFESTDVVGADAVALDLSDMDGDGYNELVVVNTTSNSVQVFENNHAGGFSNLLKTTTLLDVTIKSRQEVCGIAFADVNNDGIRDLIVVGQTNPDVNTPSLTVKTFLGNEDFTFGATAYGSQTLNVMDASGQAIESRIFISDIAVAVDSDKGLVVQTGGFFMSATVTEFNDLTSVYKFTSPGTNAWSESGDVVGGPMGGISGNTDPDERRILMTTMDLSGVSGMSSADEGIYYVTENDRDTLYFTHKTSGGNWRTWTLNYKTANAGTVTGANPIIKDADLYWAASQGTNSLVCGAISTSYKGLAVLELTGSNTGTGRTLEASYDWVESPNTTPSISDVYVCGILGSRTDTAPGVLFSEHGVSVYFTGKTGEEGEPSLTFEYAQDGLNTPDYIASTVTTLMDGSTVILAVGRDAVWGIDSSAPVETAEVKQYASDILIGAARMAEAVFGDFNGDGYIDIAAVADKSAGTPAAIYYQTQNESGNVQFTRAGVIEMSDYPFGSATGQLASLTVGNFVAGVEDELALLVKNGTDSKIVVLGKKTDGFFGDKKGESGVFSNGISLSAGDTNGNGIDEVFVGRVELTSGTEGKGQMDLYQMSGAVLTKSQTITVASASATSNDAIYVTTGDIDEDGDADLIMLHRSAKNASSLSYSLQSDGNFAAPVVIDNSLSNMYLSGLIYDYIDEDAHRDIVVTARDTNVNSNSGTWLVTWLGTGTGFETRRESTVDKTFTDEFKPTAVCYGKLTDAANDIIVVHGKTIAVWENLAKSSGSVGVADLLFQNYSSGAYAPAASLDAAKETARDWLDEWSNFYIEVWATTENAGDIETFSVKLTYNANFFTVGEKSTCNTGTSVTITSYVIDNTNLAQSTITITGTASGLGGSDASVHVLSLRFSPTGGVGVPVPSDGEFQSAQSMGYETFAIENADIMLNGLAAAGMGDSTAIDEVPLYPVTLDFNDDGVVNTDDIADAALCYGSTRADVKSDQGEKYSLLDFTYKGIINADDIANIALVYGDMWSSNLDSVYGQWNGPDSFLPPVLQSAALPEVFLSEFSPVDEGEAVAVETLVAESVVSRAQSAPVAAALPLAATSQTNRMAILALLENEEELPEVDTSEVDDFLARGFVEEVTDGDREQSVLM
ncbi:MAG: VCBS repeat-containing protein [Planctomycetia bacterium]|nr:VCBS repeat-containing protein [Planctomycetia bacterium]